MDEQNGIVVLLDLSETKMTKEIERFVLPTPVCHGDYTAWGISNTRGEQMPANSLMLVRWEHPQAS
jgi:hypothetical protein